MSEKFSERMPRCVLSNNATDCHVPIIDRNPCKTSHVTWGLASADVVWCIGLVLLIVRQDVFV